LMRYGVILETSVLSTFYNLTQLVAMYDLTAFSHSENQTI
jgi:hypothetical protein